MACFPLTLAIAAACALHAGAAFAAPQEWLQRNADRDRAAFEALDRNGDGRLTREEVAGDIDMTARFNAFDVNRDDVIDRDELARYVAERYGVAPLAPAAAATSPSPPTGRTAASSTPR
jgi:hypothetical protein